MNDTWFPGIRFNYLSDGEAIAKKVGNISFHPVNDIVIARFNRATEDLMGGVIYTNYTGHGGSILVQTAGFHHNWVNRTLLWVAFDYPFTQLGVKKIFSQIASDNLHSLEFNKNLGFEVEHVIKGVYPGQDMIVTAMARENCRFIKMPPPKLVSERTKDG